MDSPLNHLFGALQEKVHMESSQLVDKEAIVEKVWIFNSFAMEALRSQSQGSYLNLMVHSLVLVSLSLIPNL